MTGFFCLLNYFNLDKLLRGLQNKIVGAALSAIIAAKAAPTKK